jgi:hypothetical protein
MSIRPRVLSHTHCDTGHFPRLVTSLRGLPSYSDGHWSKITPRSTSYLHFEFKCPSQPLAKILSEYVLRQSSRSTVTVGSADENTVFEAEQICVLLGTGFQLVKTALASKLHKPDTA